MDTRTDRGDFYPGGETGGSAPAPQQSDKVDRVNLGEVGESYTLKDVKQKVNQIVRVIAPAAVGLMLMIAGGIGIGAAGFSTRRVSAATAPLEDIRNTSPVVTNEEDAVALATLATATNALQSSTLAKISELRSEMNTASNNLATAIGEAMAAESNRVEATYAKRSEIPAAPDLSPYALKSELPADYLRECDITNFATRAWINSQGYATEGTVYARIDAQNLALGAATNEMWQAMKSGTNKIWRANAAESNRLDAATNKLWQTARSESNRLDRTAAEIRDEIAALELTGGMTRLWSSDATTYQDATGVVWQVHKDWLYTMSGTNYTAEQMGSNFDGGYLSWEEDFEYEGPYGTNEVFTGWFVNDGSGTSPLGYWNEDWSGATNANLTSAQYLFAMQQVVARRAFTNAVKRVVYKNELAAATNAVLQGASEQTQVRIQVLEEMGTVMGATRIMPVGSEGDVTASNVWEIARNATNYTDAVARDFEDGLRSPQYASNSGHADYAVELYDEMAERLYTATDLIRESTNAAIAVSASKQDALPYPTNAIPFSAIDGAPSGGGQEWQDVWDDAMAGKFHYVTNGMLRFDIDQASIIVETNGWPNGAAMFSQIRVMEPSYTWPSFVRLVGYGTWPTNNFQSVWWRSGTNIFVNILLEE